MAKTPPRKFPVVSFGPELLAAVIRGSREKIDIRLPSYKKAVRLQQRIAMLRKAMREEHHPLAEVATRARCSVIWGAEGGFKPEETSANQKGAKFPVDRDCPALLRIWPQDSEFRKAFNAAGISDSDIEADDPLKGLFSELDSPPRPSLPARQADGHLLPATESPSSAIDWLEGVLHPASKKNPGS